MRKRTAASVFFLALAGLPALAMADALATPVSPLRALLEPEPLGFDGGTFVRLYEALVALPGEIPAYVRTVVARGAALGPSRGPLVLTVFVGIAFVLFGPRVVARRLEPRAAMRVSGAPPAVQPWLSAGIQVLTRTVPLLVLWLVYDAVQRTTGFRGPGFLLTGAALAAWLQLALTTSVWRELVVRPLLPVPEEHRTYLFRVGQGLAVYVAALAFLSDVAATLAIPADLWALVRTLANLALLVLLGLLALRKGAVMALLPRVPNRAYARFVAVLGHAYPLILGVTLVTALLGLVGYGALARFVFVRTWLVAALFVSAVALAHGLRLGLRRAVLGSLPDPSPEATRFARSATRLLDYLIVLGTGAWMLDLTGLDEILRRGLGVVVFRLADGPVSLLLLLEAVFVVMVFVFASRLVRDFLDYRVYPALAVEESISHACNVFVHYAFVIVGSLFALEFVGIGLGAITVFAGALGLGLGFGLQPLATNLSSGLTLVFGRALRRGDWVTVGDTIGQIEEVGMRATSLRTRDAVEYVVPNTQFVSGAIVNWTRSSPLVREHLSVSVAQSADPEVVRRVLEEVASVTPDVETAPPPEVWIASLGPPGIAFELAVWVNLQRVAWPPVRSALYFRIFAAFRERGIALAETEPTPERVPARARILGALGATSTGDGDASRS